MWAIPLLLLLLLTVDKPPPDKTEHSLYSFYHFSAVIHYYTLSLSFSISLCFLCFYSLFDKCSVWCSQRPLDDILLIKYVSVYMHIYIYTYVYVYIDSEMTRHQNVSHSSSSSSSCGHTTARQNRAFSLLFIILVLSFVITHSPFPFLSPCVPVFLLSLINVLSDVHNDH